MVPSGIGLAIVVLSAALIIDRLIGDPHTPLHPVALLGRFIGWWGKPEHFPPRAQRPAGVFFWMVTVLVFALPFFLVVVLAPALISLCLAPVLLKVCLAWRSLEEHTRVVISALQEDIESGREKVRMLVSRDTGTFGREQILSAAYESLTENLTDSIISPLFYFCLFGLPGAAAYRAANTMDAMLGYRDERERLGWFCARMDDVLNYIPARLTVILLFFYFLPRGRLAPAVRILRRDGKKRPGFNGGVVMAVMAGGIGVQFEKPGIYVIGDREKTLDADGEEIITACRYVTLLFVVLAGGTLFLLGSLINNICI